MQNNTFSTLFVGQNLIKLSAVDSTNNFLKNLLSNSEPLPEGTVIMADHQFAGRGQQQNTWHTEPGKNLTFSLLLYPRFLALNRQFLLNMAISVALNDALKHFLPDGVTIKWPNDVYYNDFKLGGVLIENAVVGSMIKTAVIGIGINVNQRLFNGELQSKATSLSQILQRDVNLELILSTICSQIEKYYLQLKTGRYTDLKQAYVDTLYRIDRLERYKQDGLIFEGIIKGITDNGLLIIDRNGILHHYNFKEIEFLNN